MLPNFKPIDQRDLSILRSLCYRLVFHKMLPKNSITNRVIMLKWQNCLATKQYLHSNKWFHIQVLSEPTVAQLRWFDLHHQVADRLKELKRAQVGVRNRSDTEFCIRETAAKIFRPGEKLEFFPVRRSKRYWSVCSTVSSALAESLFD